jgi:FkbM family methyltransferase
MSNQQMAERRRARALAEAKSLLTVPWSFEKVPSIKGLIQCGLGDWAEGPALIDAFKNVPWLAVEPVHRFCLEAYRDGFRGSILQAAAWHTTGEWLELNDFRSRTSIWDKEKRHLGKFSTGTVTLDDAVKFTKFQGIDNLLWMDVEGAEHYILEGAQDTLKEVVWIVCELKDEPKFDGWPSTPAMTDFIQKHGYTLIKRVSDNGLFVRSEFCVA